MTSGTRPPLDPAAVREALADAYRDAAMDGADMTQAVGVLEDLRTLLAGETTIFDAWLAANDAIGRGGPGPLRKALATARDRLHGLLLIAHLNQLRALPEDGDKRAAAWLELLARALSAATIEVAVALADVRPGGSAAGIADLLTAHRRNLGRSDLGLVSPLYAAVAAHPLVSPALRAELAARYAEIQVYRTGDLPAGRAWLDRVPADAADTVLVQNAWGTYWLARGDTEAARRYLQRAVELDPAYIMPYWNLADCYEREGDPHAALTWLEAGLENCPGRSEAYVALLVFNTQPARVEEHRDSFPALIETMEVLEPFDAGSVYLSAANAYLEAFLTAKGRDSDLDEAERWLARAVELDPMRVDTLSIRARILFARHADDAAIAVLAEADEAEPGRFGVCDAAAALCFELGWYAESASWYRRAVQSPVRQVPEATTRLLLAAALRRAGDLSAAEAELIAALRLSPGTDEAAAAVEDLAVTLLRDEGRGSAEAALDRIGAALGPGWAAWRRNAEGDLAFAESDYAHAAASYRAAIELASDAVAVYYNLAIALRKVSDFDEAREALKSARTVGRNLVRCRIEESRVANAEGNERYAEGDYAAAIMLYQEAVRLQPRDLVAATNLANAWDQLADPERRKEAADGSYEALRLAAEMAPADSVLAARLAGVSAVRAAEAEFGQLAFAPLPTPYAVQLEVAPDLVPVVTDENRNLSAEVLSRIAKLRTELATDYGVSLPGVNMTGNEAFAEGIAQIRMDGVAVARYHTPSDRRLCLASEAAMDSAGIAAAEREPAKLLDRTRGAWLAEPAWGKAEAAGLSLYSRLDTLLTPLTAVIRGNAHQFFGLQEVANAISADLLTKAPELLPDFTFALRAHVADGLATSGVDDLWSAYQEARNAGATQTLAAELLRTSTESAERIRSWCGNRPLIRAGAELQALFASRRRSLPGGPAALFAVGEYGTVIDLMQPLVKPAESGCVVVVEDPELRALIAYALREWDCVSTVVTHEELLEGRTPDDAADGTAAITAPDHDPVRDEGAHG